MPKNPQNLSRVEESIDGGEIAALNLIEPGLGNKLHRILSALGNAHAAQAGHKGTVAIKAQTAKDERGRVVPGMTFSGNRAADAADAIDDSDLVTLRQARRLLRDREPNENDLADIIPPRAGTVGGNLPVAWFWGVYVLTPDSAQQNSPAAAPPDTVPAYEFTLPFTLTVALITTQIVTARADPSRYSVGIYESVTGALLIDTGPLQAAATGVRQDAPVGGPVTLTPGRYVFAQTTNDSLIALRCFGAVIDVTIIDASYIRWGIALNTSAAGQLPPSLGGLGNFINNRPIVSTLFE